VFFSHNKSASAGLSAAETISRTAPRYEDNYNGKKVEVSALTTFVECDTEIVGYTIKIGQGSHG
jgi:hypothetical protein